MRRVSGGDTEWKRELDPSSAITPRGQSDGMETPGRWPGLPDNYLGLIRVALPRLKTSPAWRGVVLSLPYVEQFRRALVAKMRSWATLESYMRKVLQAVAEIEKNPRRWILEDLKEGQYTIAERYAHNSMIPFVAAVNGFCRANHLVDENGEFLRLESPDTRIKRKEVLTREEVEAMLRAAQADGPLYHAVMTFLARQVRRESEIRRLNVRDIDLNRRKAIIRDTKHGEDDEIDLLPPTVEALETWLEVRPRYEDAPWKWPNADYRDALFVTTWRGTHRRLSKGGFFAMVKKYAAAVGVEKTVTPHLFRHTGVTWMAERGMSYRQIALQTGHRDLETLMRFYDHPDRERAKEAFEAVMAGSSTTEGRGPGITGARDLLGSLKREDLMALFRELLLTKETDP
ncbi:MAG: tyrosine-type recombinase/integrase [Thermoplasmata archaeon]